MPDANALGASSSGRPPSALEALAACLPGFGGYRRLEDRRRADAQQREWLAERLERGKQGLERYARALVDAGQIDSLAPVDRLRGKTDQLTARIRGAVRGGGFFRSQSLEAERLERIYQHDLALIERVAAAADAMDALGDSPAGASETLNTIAAHLTALGDAWDAREDLLSEE